jgi:hypothetical protein
MNLIKKLRKLLTFKKVEKKGNTFQEYGLPFYNDYCLEEIIMSHTSSTSSQTQNTEKLICPTCECLPDKETLALKQIRINQKLDDTTSDAIVLPYYSLVPPFHSFEEGKDKETSEFNNRSYLGVMSNKKGKSAVKKLFLSIYGTIEHIDDDKNMVLLKPLADYDKETGKTKKPCVAGLELLVAASNLLQEEKETLHNDGLILGNGLEKLLFKNINVYLFEKGKEKLEGIPCSFEENQTTCYDEQLNRVEFKELKGKLVVAIVDYCIIDGGKEKCINLQFVRILGQEESKKVTELVQKYYYG